MQAQGGEPLSSRGMSTHLGGHLPSSLNRASGRGPGAGAGRVRTQRVWNGSRDQDRPAVTVPGKEVTPDACRMMELQVCAQV